MDSIIFFDSSEFLLVFRSSSWKELEVVPIGLYSPKVLRLFEDEQFLHGRKLAKQQSKQASSKVGGN